MTRPSTHGDDKPLVTREIMLKAAAEISHKPVAQISKSEGQKLMSLRKALHEEVFQQDHAIETLVKSAKRSWSGFRKKGKTRGAFLFLGPTGCGKTELAKQFAHKMDLPLIRFDMSEYMDKTSKTRLIGSDRGYIGYEEGGELIKSIEKNPHCVLVFDEIEKAHPDVQNLMLQIMDEGFITDAQGKKIDCRHVTLIMTGNVGAEAKSSMGFDPDGGKQAREAEIKNTFRPEFRGRVDEVVTFDKLQKNTMPKIVSKELRELSSNLKADRNIALQVDRDVEAYLAEEGYSDEYGARPLSRLIEQTIGDEDICDAILDGELTKGGSLRVFFNDAASDKASEPVNKRRSIHFDARPASSGKQLLLTG